MHDDQDFSAEVMASEGLTSSALARDLSQMPELLTQTRDYAQHLLDGLPSRPAAVTENPPAPAELPETGGGLSQALSEFKARWEPGFSGSAGPRYLGFVTGGATPAALGGDWLTSVLDQNALSAVGSSAAALELETVRWLGSLLGLKMAGSFVSGATMSNLVGLATGREWLGDLARTSIADEGLKAPVRVLSGAPHSSIGKAMSILGMGRRNLVQVPTSPGREAVDIAALEAELAKGPAIIVANAGTVNTVDFDDIRAIADLKAEHPFWLHVDAAFGGFAATSPRYAELLDGWTEADSICVDLHKWLNVPYDSAVQFTRRQDLQLRVFENTSAYLGEPGAVPDFMHLTPENSRRLRALAAWFTLAAYGRSGHREIVERGVECAKEMGARVESSDQWRLLAPVRLNGVCFTTASAPTREGIDAVLRQLHQGGDVFFSPTVHEGVPAIRAAFSNWRTTLADVDHVCSAIGI